VSARTYLSKAGDERLVVSTICTHLPFFHEAGFVFRTERRQRVTVASWNPSTWRGVRWLPSAQALQPVGLRCVLIQRGDVERDPADFGVTTQVADGIVKTSCEDMMARAHCVFVVNVEQPASVARPKAIDDARSVVNVCVRFGYDGQQHVLWHATPRVTHVDNASMRA
jgi:hypothetical protein